MRYFRAVQHRGGRDPLVGTISKQPRQSWGLDVLSRFMRLSGAALAAPFYFGHLNGGRAATATISANAPPRRESGCHFLMDCPHNAVVDSHHQQIRKSEYEKECPGFRVYGCFNCSTLQQLPSRSGAKRRSSKMIGSDQPAEMALRFSVQTVCNRPAQRGTCT